MEALERAGFVQPLLDIRELEACVRLLHEYTECTVSVRRVNVLPAGKCKQVRTWTTRNRWLVACVFRGGWPQSNHDLVPALQLQRLEWMNLCGSIKLVRHIVDQHALCWSAANCLRDGLNMVPLIA